MISQLVLHNIIYKTRDLIYDVSQILLLSLKIVGLTIIERQQSKGAPIRPFEASGLKTEKSFHTLYLPYFVTNIKISLSY